MVPFGCEDAHIAQQEGPRLQQRTLLLSCQAQFLLQATQYTVLPVDLMTSNKLCQHLQVANRRAVVLERAKVMLWGEATEEHMCSSTAP